MRTILLALLCAATFTANAQLGTLIGVGANLASKKINTRSRLKSEIDTFRCVSGSIPFTRYDQRSLEKSIGKGANVVLTYIVTIQNKFDLCQAGILADAQHVDLNDIKYDMEVAGRSMDVSCYRTEFDFYTKYNDAKLSDAQQKAAAAHEKEYAQFHYQDSINRVVREKRELAEREEAEEKMRIADSVQQVALAEQHTADSIANNELWKQKNIQLTKEYGAAIAKKLMYGRIWVGMTAKMLAEEFGEPEDTRTAYTAAGETQICRYTGYANCEPGDCLYKNILVTFKNRKAIYIYTENRD